MVLHVVTDRDHHHLKSAWTECEDGSLPGLAVDFRSWLGAQWELSTITPTHGPSRWLSLLGHRGWILRGKAPE